MGREGKGRIYIGKGRIYIYIWLPRAVPLLTCTHACMHGLQAAGILGGGTPGVQIQALVAGFQHALAIAQVPASVLDVSHRPLPAPPASSSAPI